MNHPLEDSSGSPIANMPTRSKTRVAGNQSVPGLSLTYGHQRRDNLSFESFVYNGNYFPIQRKIGTTSSIQYQTGKDGAFRPCTQETYYYVPRPVADQVYMWDSSAFSPANTKYPGVQVSGLSRYFHQKTYSSFLTYVNAAVTTAVDNIGWNSLGQQALNAMMPSFADGNSLVNFLLELKDFRRLMQYATGNISKRISLMEALFSFSRSDSTLKKLSKGYLSYQFGWRPLFNDIVSLYSTLVKLDHRIRMIKKQANTDLQKHYSILVAGTSLNQSTPYNSGNLLTPGSPWYSGFRGRTKVVQEACEGVRYNATLRYRYPLPKELTGIGGRTKALLDSLGVAGNPAIIWNAIPWTFVVDWVVNVGKFLNGLRVDNIRFQTEIRDFCHSAVMTRNTSYFVQVDQGFSDASNNMSYYPGPWILTDTCRHRRYVRRKGIPNFLTSMQVSGLNSREFTLAGALVGANKRK